MKKKKVPLRKCIACGENKEKRDLVRVVRDKDKQVLVDASGRANGRGAYLCARRECFEKAEKGRKLSRALQAEVPEQIYEDLKSVLELESKE